VSLSEFLFSPRGRVNRGKYWLFVVVSIAILAVVVGAMAASVVGFVHDVHGGAGFPIVAVVIVVIVYLLLLITGIFVGIKRLHDRDKSGWWLLVFYLVPAILSGISEVLSRNGIGILFALVSFGISIWAFVELGCLRGTIGPNRYGEDPLAARQPA
jgi:uncharacterized membrane protein YhaH (DUF805 family)